MNEFSTIVLTKQRYIADVSRINGLLAITRVLVMFKI